MSNADGPGIHCPRCYCSDLRVRNTVRLPGGFVRRYRVCRHCGRTVTTLEAPQARIATDSTSSQNRPHPT